MQVLMEAIPVDAAVSQLLPVVCDLHKDKVPNIRLNVAKTISKLINLAKAPRCGWGDCLLLD